jgi:hypothetical protein
MSADLNSVAADLAKLKADLAAKAAAEESRVSTWFKNNWLHLLSAGGITSIVLKVFGKL